MATPPAPFLRPDTGDWIFDASTLINLAATSSLLGLVALKFAGRAHIPEEVMKLELDKGPTGPRVRRVNWFSEEAMVVGQDAGRYSELRLRWGSKANADRGEAALLVLAHKNRWIAALDDGVGYRAACDLRVCCTRTPQLVVSFVRANWISPDEGWDALTAIADAGNRLGPIPWRSRTEFDGYCGTVGYDSCPS